jgi:hypothetical protein
MNKMLAIPMYHIKRNGKCLCYGYKALKTQYDSSRRHPHSDYQLGMYITFMVAFINYFKNLLRFSAWVSQQLNTDFDKLYLLYCDMLEQHYLIWKRWSRNILEMFSYYYDYLEKGYRLS